jgi:hypothetical protein
MLGWLQGLFGLFTGGLAAIWNAIVQVLQNIVNWTQQNLSDLYNRYNNLYVGLFRLSAYISNFITQTYVPTIAWLQGSIRLTVSWAQNNFVSLRGDLNAEHSFAANGIGSARSFAQGLFSGFVKWVIGTIFGPLSRDVATVLGWILKEGAFLFDLLTHPDKLIKLLITYILSALITLISLFAKPLFLFFLAHWKSMIPELMTIIEDIIITVL